jgi:hypothetical protein
MGYRLLADTVVILHLLFIVFGLLGGLLVMWKRWSLWLHLPAGIWICLIEFQGWICPLTPLENSLRRSAGEAGYHAGFVEHYLIPVIYPAGLTPEIQLWLGVAAVLVNLLVYGAVYMRWRRARVLM